MRRAAILALALVLAACTARPTLRAEDAWVRAAPAGAATAAYLAVVNDGDAPLALSGARCGVADSLSLHATGREDGVIRMRPAGSLAVPAHGRLRLAPGGDHLMLSGLRVPLVPGQRVTLALRFTDGRRLAVEAIVRD